MKTTFVLFLLLFGCLLFSSTRTTNPVEAKTSLSNPCMPGTSDWPMCLSKCYRVCCDEGQTCYKGLCYDGPCDEPEK